MAKYYEFRGVVDAPLIFYRKENNKMIQSYINTVTPLTSNTDAIAFQTDCIRTRSSTCCGWLNHSQGSPNYEILSDGENNAIYNLNFDATVSSATAGVVAFGLFKDGVLIPRNIDGSNNRCSR